MAYGLPLQCAFEVTTTKLSKEIRKVLWKIAIIFWKLILVNFFSRK
jgi:hypothetical protein